MTYIHDILTECKRLEDEGKDLQAIDYLSKAIEHATDDQLLYQRGIRYELIGLNDQALDDYNAAIALLPTNARYFVSRGRLLCDRLGDSRSAIADFHAAISLDPQLAAPHQHISLCYLLVSENAKALEHAKRAVELAPEDSASHFCLGQCFLASKDYDLATTHLEAATLLDMESANYWSALGSALRGLGDNERAEKCYRRAILLLPSAILWISIASIQLDLKKLELAIESLNEARKFDLTEGESLLVNGYCARANAQK